MAVEVPVRIFSDVQNIDGKLYTEDFVDDLVEKLLTRKLVFDSFKPGPRSFETGIFGVVQEINKKGKRYFATIEYATKFKFLEQRLNLAIYFSGKTASHITGTEQIFDKGDIIDPIIFSIVELAK